MGVEAPLMKRDYDTIVLGLGGIGAGALYWLARRLGGEVLGLEQYPLGHDRGGSQDHSRIIRYSYHHPIYVRLAERAYRAWAAVERETGEQLVYRCGGLDLFPADGSIPPGDYVDSLEACGIPFDRLEAAEIRRRWPAWRLADSVWGLFQVDGGLVAAAKANAAHLRAAQLAGAAIRENLRVTVIGAQGGEVTLTAGGATYRARRLVVTAGAWSNDALRHFGVHLPLTVTREQVVYYAARDLAPFALERLPVWIWMDEPCFYGFPVFGEQAVKVAEDVGGYETTATTRSFDPDPAGLARVRSWCETHLPGAVGPEHLVKTCLYTLTPDRDFVVDTIPGHPEVVVAIGAGHAFKFASALGQILSELVVEGTTDADLSAFAIDRPILQMADPPKSFFI
jgi:sarcosine oxidase